MRPPSLEALGAMRPLGPWGPGAICLPTPLSVAKTIELAISGPMNGLSSQMQNEETEKANKQRTGHYEERKELRWGLETSMGY